MHPDYNYFGKYKKDHRIFIETGTYKGDGCRIADQAGFEIMHTIDPIFYRDSPLPGNCKRWVGKSVDILPKILEEIKEPALFWLDGHSQLLPGEEECYPLLDELKIIATHEIKTHTILIDDILILTHPDVTGWPLFWITDELLKINPKYAIERLPNPINNNLLIAQV